MSDTTTIVPPAASITTLTGPTVIDETLLVGQGPIGPAWPSAGVQAASEAARDAAIAARQAADADALATAADRLQCDLDVIAATNQANLAAASAASAASVVQQDLSGVSGAALHRSPNAVTALFTYNAANDSDGAWIDKCQATSWYNEPLNGVWRGWLADEAACRAISGAATNDYFGKISDGKFYKLNAGAGTTEVFRGNKAKPGHQMQLVAEASRVVVYDLTEPGRPMWMVFTASSSTFMLVVAPGIVTVGLLNGKIWFGGTAGQGLVVVDLIKDAPDNYRTNGLWRIQGNVSQRNTVGTLALVDSTKALAATQINTVAMAVLPDAQVDPMTGIQVPTIVVATTGGTCVIKSDGTVVSDATNATNAAISDEDRVLMSSSPNSGAYLQYQAQAPLSAATASLVGWSALRTSNGAESNFGGNNNKFTKTRKGALCGSGNVAEVVGFAGRFVTTPPVKPMVYRIRDTFNTGWMLGDIRRCLLADVSAGSVSGAEMISDPLLNTPAAWFVFGSSMSIGGGQITVNGALGNGTIGNNAGMLLTVGKTYKVTVIVSAATATLGTRLATMLLSGGSIYQASAAYIQAPGVFTWTFTCLAAAVLGVQNVAASATTIDSISVTEAVDDRSSKAQSISVFGTLTKTAVAAGAQLVAYSGFSAANYLQEPYSADLDFGTGSWRASAWVSYTSTADAVILERAAATGAYIKIGTASLGCLVVQAYDGTTTRTVITPAAYNTGAPLHVAANYTPNGAASTLTIEVNGVVVATSGAIAAMLTMNNAAAVLTVGQTRILNAQWTGSIALAKLGATIPTAEQAAMAAAQEAKLFVAGAQITLPEAGAVQDLSYDPDLDKWCVAQPSNVSCFTGLVRTMVTPTPSGTFSKISSAAGITAWARITTNPGVDITIPAQNLRDELANRALTAARLDVVKDFDAVAGQVAFPLPAGYTAVDVQTAGTTKREGAAKDFTRTFDGFVETPTYNVAPGAAAWVRVKMRRFP